MYHVDDRAIVPASYRNSRSLPDSYALVHQSNPRAGVRYASGGAMYNTEQPGATMYRRQTMYHRAPVVYHQNGRTRYYGNQNTMYHTSQGGRYHGQGALYHRNSRAYQGGLGSDAYTGRNSYHEQRYVVPLNSQHRYIRGYDPHARSARRYDGYRDTYRREVVADHLCCVIT